MTYPLPGIREEDSIVSFILCKKKKKKKLKEYYCITLNYHPHRLCAKFELDSLLGNILKIDRKVLTIERVKHS